VGVEPRRPGVARASVIETEGPVKDRWWEKNLPPNMSDLHSTQVRHRRDYWEVSYLQSTQVKLQECLVDVIPAVHRGKTQE